MEWEREREKRERERERRERERKRERDKMNHARMTNVLHNCRESIPVFINGRQATGCVS